MFSRLLSGVRPVVRQALSKQSIGLTRKVSTVSAFSAVSAASRSTFIGTSKRIVAARFNPVGPTMKVAPGGQQLQIRNSMGIHEYQAMALLKKNGVAVPQCKEASTPAEAEAAAASLEGPDYVVKAQVLAGGRGKGKFTNGFEGGVQLCNSVLEARSLAAKMLGQRLITKQTGAEGKPVNKVLITERLYLRRETYFAILMDRQSEGPVLVASPKGGMNIEDVAATTPEAIFKEPIDMEQGVSDAQVERLARKMGFNTASTIQQTKDLLKKLYGIFLKYDCTLIEVNPMGETHNGRVLCVDIKLNFDENADFRQKDIFSLRDTSQSDPREVEAGKNGLNYIGLDGDIGCLVNGAGLAMATMDVIKLYGGSPANFLDMGGGANAGQVTEAFKLLNSDKQVRAILVNIFGGIMRCDVIALGLLKAANELGLKKPLIVRLAGTNMKEARKLIEESGTRMVFADDLNEAAQKAVRVVDILKMAEQADLKVAFELPL